MTVRRNNDFGKLEQVMLGRYYTPEYFNFIESASVREPLMKISEEINQDLEFFEQVIKDQGCEVVRPDLVSIEQFQDHYEQGNGLLKPPIFPRDNHAVIGSQLFELTKGLPNINSVLRQVAKDNYIDISKENSEFFQASMDKQKDRCYNAKKDLWYSEQKYNELAGDDWPPFEKFVKGYFGNKIEIIRELVGLEKDLAYQTNDISEVEGPNILFCRGDVIVDTNEYCDYSNWLSSYLPGRNIRTINTGGGHTDGCFSVLNDNCIIGIDPLIDYATHFPGHTLIPIPNNHYIDLISEHRISLKEHHYERWWVSGEEGNRAFSNFVDKYLSDWTGYVSETYFDVNVLSLSPNLVAVPNNIAGLPEKLKKNNIDCIIVPWRHRFFVDGGLNCITLDLRRE
tara:strand:- start:291 stop:1481 length:1191 start_codon:yes stop_codon:yes gene_type:complete